jgi:shikimate dehydrogenase
MSKLYAEVIGDPIAHSKSPLIHNFWLEKLGIDAEYRARHVRPEELADYLAQRREDANWRGCNVTMPHKQALLPLLGALEPDSARIGAVNTVLRVEDGTLIGYNTDAPGFFEPLRALLGDEPFHFAYVIGTGGAARAIIDALYAEDFLIWSISRNRAKAKAEFFDYLGRDEDFLLELADLQGGPLRPADPEVFSLIVNATPLGMSGYPPLDLSWGGFLGNAIAYDIVTSPHDTEFLQAARAQGLRTIGGLAMLIGQAAVAFEMFFGQPAPRQHDAELRALLTV